MAATMHFKSSRFLCHTVLESSTVATFADDTAILATGSSNEESIEKLQTAINQIQKWTKNGTSNLTNLNQSILTIPTDALNTSQ
jgi:hypothetical protein